MCGLGVEAVSKLVSSKDCMQCPGMVLCFSPCQGHDKLRESCWNVSHKVESLPILHRPVPVGGQAVGQHWSALGC